MSAKCKVGVIQIRHGLCKRLTLGFGLRKLDKFFEVHTLIIVCAFEILYLHAII